MLLYKKKMKIDQVRVVNSNNLIRTQTQEILVVIIIVGKIIVSKQNNNVSLFRIHFSCKKKYLHS